MEGTSQLHCIDLSDPDIQKSVSLLRKSCLDCGFFYVVNHGISQEFMDDTFAATKKFFDLPIEEKMKLLRNENNRGYMPMLSLKLDTENQNKGDHNEGFYLATEVPEDDPRAKQPLMGPNLWPSADLLPGWKQTMEKYYRETLEVAKTVGRLVALALDLDGAFFDKPEMLGDPFVVMGMIHYEGSVSDPSKGIYGTGAHSDWDFITLLATDDVMGLQICKDKDAQPQKWEYVQPLKGAFIVNIGDMLERWSNGIFRSILHRVVLNGQERYSMPFFFHPQQDCIVECLPSCQSETNPPKFPPVTCRAFLAQKYKETKQLDNT